MVQDGPKLKAQRELGPPEIARRFAAADGRPSRTQAARPPVLPTAAPPPVKAKEPRDDGIALQRAPHPAKPFKKRFRRKLQTKTLETVEIEIPAVPYAKTVRLLTGLTQADFAAAHGFSRRTFEGWERGASEPNDKARAKLADIEAKARAAKGGEK